MRGRGDKAYTLNVGVVTQPFALLLANNRDYSRVHLNFLFTSSSLSLILFIIIVLLLSSCLFFVNFPFLSFLHS